MTEQAAANLTERQHAFDDAVTLRIEKMTAMTEGALEHAGPAGAMKESGLRACDYEGIPPIGIGRGQALDDQTRRCQARFKHGTLPVRRRRRGTRGPCGPNESRAASAASALQCARD